MDQKPQVWINRNNLEPEKRRLLCPPNLHRPNRWDPPTTLDPSGPLWTNCTDLAQNEIQMTANNKTTRKTLCKCLPIKNRYGSLHLGLYSFRSFSLSNDCSPATNLVSGMNQIKMILFLDRPDSRPICSK